MSGRRSSPAISFQPHPRCSALVAAIAISVLGGGATLRLEGLRMGRPAKTAKHKLNGSYVHGALIVAGLLGAISGSWTIFLVVAGILIATCLHDGSIRL